MPISRTRRTGAAVVAAIACVSVTACSGGGADDGADYPTENIEVIVPFSAGGPTDTVTRLVADPMGAELGQQMVVQNVEGAGGTIGAGEASRARPDGYTLLLHHIGMSTAPALYENLPYDPQADFAPVGLVAEVPMTIISRNDLGPTTMDELATYIQQNQSTITYANAGVGSASQLCGLLLERALGVDFQEVPYDGAGPAIADVVGGQVDFMCDQTTNTSGQIRGGEVTAYAVTTPERLESLPDLQTTAEAGLPDLELSIWHGLYAPAETPEAVISKLEGALQTALADEAVANSFSDLGATVPAAEDQTPDGLAARLAEQTTLWGEVISEPVG